MNGSDLRCWGFAMPGTMMFSSHSYYLNYPSFFQNPSFTEMSETGFTASWDAVEEADGYLLSVFTLDGETRHYVMEDLPVTETHHNVTGIDLNTIHYFVVKAKDATRVSTESRCIEVLGIFKAPEAKEPTDVTTDGFSANWTGLDNAQSYMLQTYIIHTAPRDENYSIISEDFDGTEPYFGTAGYLDAMFNRAGWFAYFGTNERQGCFGLNNSLNFITNATLVSPMFDIPGTADPW